MSRNYNSKTIQVTQSCINTSRERKNKLLLKNKILNIEKILNSKRKNVRKNQILSPNSFRNKNNTIYHTKNISEIKIPYIFELNYKIKKSNMKTIGHRKLNTEYRIINQKCKVKSRKNSRNNFSLENLNESSNKTYFSLGRKNKILSLDKTIKKESKNSKIKNLLRKKIKNIINNNMNNKMNKTILTTEKNTSNDNLDTEYLFRKKWKIKHIKNTYNDKSKIIKSQLNNVTSPKIKELKHKKELNKLERIIKPKQLSFQSKNIFNIKTLSKKGLWLPGMDKSNQDSFFIENNINNNSKYIYIGVCDGHGKYGAEISQFLSKTLPKKVNNLILKQNIKYLNYEPINNLSKIIAYAYVGVDKDLNKCIKSYISGSTCGSILFLGRRIISINVGDSRAIMGKYYDKKWHSLDLTRDHKPNLEDEKKRILLKGGRVEPLKDEFDNIYGELRVWIKSGINFSLAVTRSFRDQLAHKIGVISIPEIKEYILLEEDTFIIIASDGLWTFVSSEEVVNIVKDYYIKNDIDNAINHLYKLASKRWISSQNIIDDITIIIVFMD